MSVTAPHEPTADRGSELLTATDTAADVVTFPEVSRALALSVCAPCPAVVVSQLTP